MTQKTFFLCRQTSAIGDPGKRLAFMCLLTHVSCLYYQCKKLWILYIFDCIACVSLAYGMWGLLVDLTCPSALLNYHKLPLQYSIPQISYLMSQERAVAIVGYWFIIVSNYEDKGQERLTGSLTSNSDVKMNIWLHGHWCPVIRLEIRKKPMRNEKHGAGGIGLDTLAVKHMRPPKAHTKCLLKCSCKMVLWLVVENFIRTYA